MRVSNPLNRHCTRITTRFKRCVFLPARNDRLGRLADAANRPDRFLTTQIRSPVEFPGLRCRSPDGFEESTETVIEPSSSDDHLCCSNGDSTGVYSGIATGVPHGVSPSRVPRAPGAAAGIRRLRQLCICAVKFGVPANSRRGSLLGRLLRISADPGKRLGTAVQETSFTCVCPIHSRRASQLAASRASGTPDAAPRCHCAKLRGVFHAGPVKRLDAGTAR
jgi:hypothetical protein